MIYYNTVTSISPKEYMNLHYKINFRRENYELNVKTICESDILSCRINSDLINLMDNLYVIKINQYRNNNSNTSIQEKDRIVSLARQKKYSKSSQISIAVAFFGKATLEQFRIALSAISELKNFSEQELQIYSNKYLGLDCSGFINSFYTHKYKLKGRGILQYYDDCKNSLRKNINHFKAEDILIWCDETGNPVKSGRGRHIAIINKIKTIHISKKTLVAEVVESTGTIGLVCSLYTFRQIRDGVYKIWRGCKPNTTGYVRVMPVC